MNDVPEIRAKLLARLSELETRLDGIEDELESHTNRDWDDRAIEREGDEVLEGLGLAGQDEIVRIRAALVRVENGEYGICTKCGEGISPQRLEVLPTTALCRDCAASVAS